MQASSWRAAGAWEWDIKSGRTPRVDARFANLYGLDPVAAAEGLPTAAFFAPVHAEDRLRLKIAVAGALYGAEVFARDFRVVAGGRGALGIGARPDLPGRTTENPSASRAC
jgi:hypothetical protein